MLLSVCTIFFVLDWPLFYVILLRFYFIFCCFRVRGKIFDESLQKLNQYCEVFNSKKQQRNEIITNERSGGFNLLKIGTQSSRNPIELVNQKMEERTKNVVMNKRVRSSVAEIRVCKLQFFNCIFYLHQSHMV